MSVVTWMLTAGDSAAFLTHLRAALRARRPRPRRPVPGVVFVQIDGLAAPLLRGRSRSGDLPTLGRWLRSGSHTFADWHAQLPATTPASQAGLLHGRSDQVPAFRWYEKDSGRLLVANRPRDAARDRVPAQRRPRTARRRRGEHQQHLLRRRADQPADHERPVTARRAGPAGPRLRHVLAQPVRPDPVAGADRRRDRQGAAPGPAAAAARGAAADPPRTARTSLLRGVTNVLLRDLNLALIAEQMMPARRSVYCDFVDYDEIAHHAGPTRPESLASLAGHRPVVGVSGGGGRGRRRARTSSWCCPTTARARARRSGSATACRWRTSCSS